MQILHLSDVHFGAFDDTGGQIRITNGLIAALEKIESEPSLVIFSGDLANAGSVAQFEQGREWLKVIFARTGWKSKLVIVPGNHDVDRNVARLHKPWLRPLAEPAAYPAARQMLTTNIHHLNNFFEFHHAARHDLPIIGDWSATPFGYHETFYYENLPIHVIALNSALFSCDDDDKNNILVDIQFLNTALAECVLKPGLVIVVSHHPLDWLKEQNKASLETYLSQDVGAHLFLSGHLHALETRFVASTESGRLTHIAAGACYQSEKYPNLFSLISLDIKKKRILTTPYRYNLKTGNWYVDNSIVKTIPAELPDAVEIADSKEVLLNNDLAEALSIEHFKANENNSKFDPEEFDEADLRRRAALIVEEAFLPYFDTIDIKGYKYGMKSRVKSIERVVEKIRSRKTNNPEYNAQSLVDICGFRIVTFYQDQIPSVLSNILNSISEHGYIGQMKVKNGNIELDVNTNRPLNDPVSLIQDIIQVAQTSGLEITPVIKSKPTGYSSVHLVLRVEFDPPFDGKISEMPVEIQIRSALEDIWSDIDRDIRYSRNRGDVGPSWARHLNVFKHMIDALDQYADMIQMHAKTDASTPPEEIKRSRTITTSEEQLRWLRLFNLPPSIISKFEEVYALWDRAEAERALGGNPDLRRQVAEAFFAILFAAEAEIRGNKRGKDEVRIVVWGEAAYMLMYTGGIDDQLTAEENYKKILARRKNDAISYFRLGALYSLKGELTESLTYFNRCIEILDGGLDNRIRSDHWMYDKARLSIGIVSWRHSQNEELDLETRRKHIKEAFSTALSVVRQPSKDVFTDNIFHNAINDLLYYYYESKIIFNMEMTSEINKKEIDEYVNVLNSFVLATENCPYSFLDTLLRFKNDVSGEGSMLADKLMRTLVKVVEGRTGEVIALDDGHSRRWASSITKHLDRDEEDAFHFSLEVLDGLPDKRN